VTRAGYAAYAGETRRTPELLWTAARRAIELDHGLAEGYAALASMTRWRRSAWQLHSIRCPASRS
jgi:hypothetical protein